jgi:cytochrome b561
MSPFEQMKLVYDYIKFHLGLYLATPPVFVIVAEAFEVNTTRLFQVGLVAMIVVFGLSGAHAGLFMGKFVNTKWNDQTQAEFDRVAYAASRRNWHHTLYWVGLGIGIVFLAAAIVCKSASVTCPLCHK